MYVQMLVDTYIHNRFYIFFVNRKYCDNLFSEMNKSLYL